MQTNFRFLASRSICHVFFILIALFLSPGVRAEDDPVAGHWEGAIQTPGVALDVLIDLSRDGETWSGTIDIPLQKAKGLALTGIEVDGTEVRFAIAGIPGEPTFSGQLDGPRLAGSFTQAGQSFPFELSRDGKAAAGPRRPQEPKPPFPYRVEEVRFLSAEDVELAGTMTLPQGQGPFPGVVLVSGSGPQNRDEEIFGHKPFLVLADHLTRAGIAVLRYDERGVGDSTGDFAAATTEDFAIDAEAALQHLRAWEEVDSAKIGILGHSEGGIVGPRVVARGQTAVAFLVLLGAPAVPGAEVLTRQSELLLRAAGTGDAELEEQLEVQAKSFELLLGDAPETEVRAGLLKLAEAQVAAAPEAQRAELGAQIERQIGAAMSPWMRFFLRHDPREDLRQVRVPVLALNGGLDLQVETEQNLPQIKEALHTAGNRDVTVAELEGLNHLFQKAETGLVSEYGEIEETVHPPVLAQIRDWIVERFTAVGVTQ